MKSRADIIERHRRSQPIEELRRKAFKARCKSYWTVEDLDHAHAEAADICRYFNDQPTTTTPLGG